MPAESYRFFSGSFVKLYQNNKKQIDLAILAAVATKTTKEDGLPPFTFLHSIVRHVRKSGKRMQKCADYMVIKPFERGVNLC